MLKITVPASSANLGAGFDALGLALTLYNRVWMEEADGCHIESADGVPIPTDETNLIYHTARVLYRRCGRPFRGLHIRQENNIPMARGLGSSSACLVAGLLGANTLLGSPLGPEDVADLATTWLPRCSAAWSPPLWTADGSTPSAYRCRNASASLFSSRISS